MDDAHIGFNAWPGEGIFVCAIAGIPRKITRRSRTHLMEGMRELLKDRPGPALTMKAVVEKLSDDEAEQVAAYLQGLQQRSGSFLVMEIEPSRIGWPAPE